MNDRIHLVNDPGEGAAPADVCRSCEGIGGRSISSDGMVRPTACGECQSFIWFTPYCLRTIPPPSLMGKATPLPWTAEFLGGRELGEQGVMASLESVSSPFSRADHRDDEAFTAAAVNAIPALLDVVEAAKKYRDAEKRIETWMEDGCGGDGIDLPQECGKAREELFRKIAAMETIDAALDDRNARDGKVDQ